MDLTYLAEPDGNKGIYLLAVGGTSSDILIFVAHEHNKDDSLQVKLFLIFIQSGYF